MSDLGLPLRPRPVRPSGRFRRSHEYVQLTKKPGLHPWERKKQRGDPYTEPKFGFPTKHNIGFYGHHPVLRRKPGKKALTSGTIWVDKQSVARPYRVERKRRNRLQRAARAVTRRAA